MGKAVKVLFVATIDEHIRHFHLPYIKWLCECGHQVDVAAQGQERFEYVTNKFDIPFGRSPLALSNWNASKLLKKVVEDNKYAFVHFHTPVASMFGRAAIRSMDCKVLYTAHGFHFFKGASTLRWLYTYPTERLAAHWTDALITINSEDYDRAAGFTLRKGGELYRTHGIGVDLNRVNGSNGTSWIYQDLGIPKEGFKVLSVGELTNRKNHEIIIRAIEKLRDKTIYYLIAGSGPLKEKLESLACELGIAEQVRFLGYCKDVASLYHSCDVFAFPSTQEGLPIALAEAMAAGMPCVASNVRGNRDLIVNGENGILCMEQNALEYARKIQTIKADRELGNRLGAKASTSIQGYALERVMKEMQIIYGRYLETQQ